MFTGIVQAVGRIAALEPRGGDVRLRVETASLPLDGVRIGDSISVSGACLTAVEIDGEGFAADVSNETLECTKLGHLEAGSSVNLECSLTPHTALGGHLVTGHVDGLGSVINKVEDARSTRFEFEVPDDLKKYIAAKGSVCVDGVSLTVNSVEDTRFSVNIIPHTAEVTTLGSTPVGGQVNIEVDLLARYVERLLAAGETHGSIHSHGTR